MRGGFGLNTNLLETNVLNLAVVLGIVVVIGGASLRDLLEKRRQAILSVLQEAEQKAGAARRLLAESNKAIEIARARAQEIRIEAIQSSKNESPAIQRRLEEDLQRLQRRGVQSIELQRQRIAQSTTKKIIDLAFSGAEDTLIKALRPQGSLHLKQKELNEAYVLNAVQRMKIS